VILALLELHIIVLLPRSSEAEVGVVAL